MTADDALRQGRFTRALERLQTGDGKGHVNAAVPAEVLYGLGRSDQARGLAEAVVAKSLDPVALSRALGVLAALTRDEGRSEEAVRLCQRALDAAARSQEFVQIALATIELLERSCDENGLQASLPIAAKARQAALRAGDPQISARLHLAMARLAARSGSLDLAQRHFGLARNLLSLAPNEWLSASANIDESGVSALVGDLTGAIELAGAGAASAASSGWSKGRLVAAANLAHLLVAVGRFAEAEAQLQIAQQEPFRSAAYDLVLADTAAQLAICKGDYGSAEQLLIRWEQTSHSFEPWYRLALQATRVRLLLLQGRAAEARERASECLVTAHASGLNGFKNGFTLAEAEAAEHPSDVGRALDGFLRDVTTQRPLSVAGGVQLLIGKRLLAQGREPSASSYLRRAALRLSFADSRLLIVSANQALAGC